MEILEARTDIGLIRGQNEDSVDAIYHPRNKNIKLLIVADGMGGRQHGEVASKYVVDSIKRWFINRGINTLNKSEKTKEQLIEYIKKLNSNLVEKYGIDMLGTTLSLALINNKKTIVLNVGDSRCYVYKDNRLMQVLEDDSDVWHYYKNRYVKKDHLRFFETNNIITSCIGISEELCNVSYKIIKNDYQVLMVFTDGVTDMVMDKRISEIIKKSKKKDLLNNIINEAVYVNQHYKIPFYMRIKKYSKYVIPFPGRDNASGAIYIK